MYMLLKIEYSSFLLLHQGVQVSAVLSVTLYTIISQNKLVACLEIHETYCIHKNHFRYR